MRVRNHGIAAVVVAAAVTLSGANVARAQGSQPSAPSAAPLTPGASRAGAPGVSVGTLGLERIFAPPAVFDQAWARAVQAVLDGMKHLMDAERIEAAEALGGAPIPPVDRVGATQAGPPLRYVPAWRAAWTPAKAVREALSTAPVQPTPVAVEPPTESDTDTRGEHAVLLGATMALPWRVP